MKKFFIIMLGLAFLLVSCSLDDSTGNDDPGNPQEIDGLCINEFMSHNDTAWPGPNNDNPDWIELYNGSDETIDVGGMYLTDKLDDLTMSMIGDNAPELTTMAPGSFLVLIADGNPEFGPLHLDFKLSDNEDFALVYSDGSTIADQANSEVVPDDMSMGRVPDGTDNWVILDPSTPGVSNTTEPGIHLVINEFMASNDYSIVDENGDHEDWIEIYNAGTQAVDIGGMWVTDDLANPMTSMIPDTNPEITTIQPGGYLILWADKQPEQGILHLDDVKLSGSGEDIGLFDVDGVTLIDGFTFGAQTTDISYGRMPDGSDNWEYFGEGHDSMPTPGAANGSGDAPQAILFINEFLASNDSTNVDEFDEADDWIEIYNAGNIPKDIGGMWVTDDLEAPQTSMIPTDDPSLTTIPPGGYLILWADKQPEQGILHLDDVKLSGGGEDIGLFDVDGVTLIDSYIFGEQTTDVSEGRMPDGSDNWQFFTTPTPGAPNQ